MGKSKENCWEIAALIELAGGELVMLEVNVENSGQVGRVLINTDVSVPHKTVFVQGCPGLAFETLSTFNR